MVTFVGGALVGLIGGWLIKKAIHYRTNRKTWKKLVSSMRTYY